MISSLFLHIHAARVSKHVLKPTYTFALGLISAVLFFVLSITGLALMLYYVPYPPESYRSIKDLQFVVTFGVILRNMHRWAAHAMVAVVFLHMCRVFWTGSYKRPREFNWVIGVALLLLTLGLSFTGYLLPWDQLSIWAVTVGSNMGRATPLLGHEGPFHEVLGVNPIYDARAFLFGGGEIGPHTLLRFYILHCIFFPLLASLFMAVHFWRIRRDGISGPL